MLLVRSRHPHIHGRRAPSPLAGRAAVGLALFAAACAPGGPAPSSVGRGQAPLVAAGATGAEHAIAAGGMPSGLDERGVPAFIFSLSAQAPARGTDADRAARFHIERYSAALGLQKEAMNTLAPAVVHDFGAGGVLARVQQRVDGIQVYGRELRLLMRHDGTLVAMSGRLHPTTTPIGKSAFRVPPSSGLAGALGHVFSIDARGTEAALLQVAAPADAEETEVRFQLGDNASRLVMPEGAVVRKTLFPQGDELRPAWYVEFYAGPADSTGSQAWRYVMAADDGSILERVSLTQEETFYYKVWAEHDGDNRPTDGPTADPSPHPTGRLDYGFPPSVQPAFVAMEGFNKNPMGKGDPWLPANAKDTQGNNADAYVDRRGPDGVGGDYRAATTGPLTFDRGYDFGIAPDANKEEISAGITQAFYTVNWLHDYYYDSKFDEKAGNAQKDNYMRGGRANDLMRVETQDGSGRNNANMSTPGDGFSPRMQMFLWDGREQRTLHVDPGDATYTSNSANFGPDKFDITGDLVAADDGAFTKTDACEPIKNDLMGKIALIDRGTCTFKQKAVYAEERGAIGVIIANNQASGAPAMGNGAPMATVLNIPVLSTTLSGGLKLRDLMAADTVTVRLARVRDIDRDAALDSSVVAHEWGHYLHHRLADCGRNQCGGMSEGWGDFNSILMGSRAGENLDGVYPTAAYAGVSSQFASYFGIRRYPYSTDFMKNPLTFRHIMDGELLPTLIPQQGGGPNSEVHNTGEVWATMMWEVYVALQKAGAARNPPLPFEQVRRKMADYVVASLQLTPANATFSEARDATLAAAAARDMEDFNLIAQAFARRGLGSCADSPPRNSPDNKGTVESFKVQERLVVVDSTLDESLKTCDMDGVLDSGESATITITLANGAPTDLNNAHVNLISATPEVTISGQTSFDIPSLKPLEKHVISTTVTVDPTMAKGGTFRLKVDGSTATNCGGATPELSWKINYDVKAMIARTDDVEAEPDPEHPVWVISDIDRSGEPDPALAARVWTRNSTSPTNHTWHANDLPQFTDARIESPDLKVSTGVWFSMSFRHRHQFENDTMMMPTAYPDGGVIELSDDGGMNWKDLSEWKTTPGYNGRIDEYDIPIHGQRAFVGQNALWPGFDTVRINFTDQFAGKTVRVRFRIVTGPVNVQGQFLGWDIDDIAFDGIDNTPFSAITWDAGKCGTGERDPSKLTLPTETSCQIGRGNASSYSSAAMLLGVGLALVMRRRRRRA